MVISHDIESTFKIADTVAMLYHNKIVEIGKPGDIKSSENLVLQQFIQGKAEGPIQVV